MRGEMTALSLTNVEITTVKPHEKSEHPTHLNPAFLDLSLIDGYIPLTFFYRLENSTEAYLQLIATLKESLAKILVSFYPMAGRWQRTYDSKVRVLSCNDEGVPFIEAFVDKEMDTLVDVNDFKPRKELSGYELLGLDSTLFSQVVNIPLPSMFIQVTRFRCGSISLGTTFSHMTGDGLIMVEFLRAWSHVALHGQTSIIPNSDRSKCLPNLVMTDYLPLDDIAVDLEKASSSNPTAPRADIGDIFRAKRNSSTQSRFFKVSKGVVEALKKEAAAQNIRLTTVDCITAHLWRAFANLPLLTSSHSTATETLLGSFVEGRKRYSDPPLSGSYVGNVAFLVHFPRKSSEEISSIVTAGSIVHDTVQGVTPSTLKEMFDKFVYCDFENFKGRHLIVTSWYRFPMYEVEFPCGKPILACANTEWNSFPYDGFCVIYPAAPGSDHLAALQFGVTEEIHQHLLADDTFMSLFTTD